MIPMIRSLYQHQAWADAAILGAIRKQPEAAASEEMRKALHHILMVQRAFVSFFRKQEFDLTKESQVPASLDEFERLFRETHQEEMAFVNQLDDSQLSRILVIPWSEEWRPSLDTALVQVIMHSQHHRGQCAARLRSLGGTPPTMDYLLWAKDRPAPVWS